RRRRVSAPLFVFMLRLMAFPLERPTGLRGSGTAVMPAILPKKAGDAKAGQAANRCPPSRRRGFEAADEYLTCKNCYCNCCTTLTSIGCRHSIPGSFVAGPRHAGFVDELALSGTGVDAGGTPSYA